MSIFSSVLDATSNTPLIKLRSGFDPKTMATILLKAEFLQPSGSLKDRMAKHIVESFEKDGTLKPGGTVVEATAGNTGLAVAMVCAVKGYKSIFVIPDKFSVEKINMLKAFGSNIITTPTAVPDDHPDSWREVAKRIVSENDNYVLVNQFFNSVNVKAHYENTGPEIWEQTGGKIDAFISGAGSGGTISGVGKYLKEKKKELNQDIKIILMDPVGSVYLDTYYKHQKQEKKGWKMEGIGNDFIPSCLDFTVIDEVRKVTDKKAFFYARKLAREEGLLVGDTAGAGVSIALEVARELGPGKTVVCVLCDSGNRYISKLYNDDWMKNNGFGTLGLELQTGNLNDILSFKGSEVVFADETQTIEEVTDVMAEKGISQMPIYYKKTKSYKLLHESDLLSALLSGEKSSKDLAIAVATDIAALCRSEDDIAKIEPVLEENNAAFVIDSNDKIIGVITRIDIVRYLSKRSKIS